MSTNDITSVDVTIHARVSAEGHQFSEIHYKFRENGGSEKYALTRLSRPVPNNAYQRNYEAQQFIKRRNPAWGAQ